MTQQIPEAVAERLKLLLAAIAKLFKASRITLIVRSPEDANSVGDLVFSSDSPAKVMEVLRAHMLAEAQRFADEGAKSGTPGAEWPHQRDMNELREKD